MAHQLLLTAISNPIVTVSLHTLVVVLSPCLGHYELFSDRMAPTLPTSTETLYGDFTPSTQSIATVEASQIYALPEYQIEAVLEEKYFSDLDVVLSPFANERHQFDPNSLKKIFGPLMLLAVGWIAVRSHQWYRLVLRRWAGIQGEFDLGEKSGTNVTMGCLAQSGKEDTWKRKTRLTNLKVDTIGMCEQPYEGYVDATRGDDSCASALAFAENEIRLDESDKLGDLNLNRESKVGLVTQVGPGISHPSLQCGFECSVDAENSKLQEREVVSKRISTSVELRGKVEQDRKKYNDKLHGICVESIHFRREPSQNQPTVTQQIQHDSRKIEQIVSDVSELLESPSWDTQTKKRNPEEKLTVDDPVSKTPHNEIQQGRLQERSLDKGGISSETDQSYQIPINVTQPNKTISCPSPVRTRIYGELQRHRTSNEVSFAFKGFAPISDEFPWESSDQTTWDRDEVSTNAKDMPFYQDRFHDEQAASLEALPPPHQQVPKKGGFRLGLKNRLRGATTCWLLGLGRKDQGKGNVAPKEPFESRSRQIFRYHLDLVEPEKAFLRRRRLGKEERERL